MRISSARTRGNVAGNSANYRGTTFLLVAGHGRKKRELASAVTFIRRNGRREEKTCPVALAGQRKISFLPASAPNARIPAATFLDKRARREGGERLARGNFFRGPTVSRTATEIPFHLFRAPAVALFHLSAAKVPPFVSSWVKERPQEVP